VGSDGKSGWGKKETYTFQSTLPVWGATSTDNGFILEPGVSIHAPRVGSDIGKNSEYLDSYMFQSTLPVWGATSRPARCSLGLIRFNPRSPCGERPTITTRPRHASRFNPRSPCGERPELLADCQAIDPVSIHAPRVGSDGQTKRQHTRSLVSIHAPRVGSDELDGFV